MKKRMCILLMAGVLAMGPSGCCISRRHGIWIRHGNKHVAGRAKSRCPGANNLT